MNARPNQWRMPNDKTGADSTAPTVDEGRVPDDLPPMEELEMMDLQVEAAGLDEQRTMFDPDVAPRAPSPKEEGVTDVDGHAVDLMADTPAVDLEVGVDDVGVDL